MGGQIKGLQVPEYKIEVIPSLFICIFHILRGSCVYVCVCVRVHVLTHACMFMCLLFVYTNQSKRIDTRKWSMIGNTVFYLKKKKSSFHNCTLLGRGTHLKI